MFIHEKRDENVAEERSTNRIESLQENGIPAADIKKLKDAGYYTIEAVKQLFFKMTSAIE